MYVLSDSLVTHTLIIFHPWNSFRISYQRTHQLSVPTHILMMRTLFPWLNFNTAFSLCIYGGWQGLMTSIRQSKPIGITNDHYCKQDKSCICPSAFDGALTQTIYNGEFAW